MSELISKIHSGEFLYHDNLSFYEAIDLLRDVRINNYYPNWPAQFSACKKCEYKIDYSETTTNKKSGFEHCFKSQYNWKATDFNTPNILIFGI